jgi:uncharacterized repeat protein (TIGR01451 family)
VAVKFPSNFFRTLPLALALLLVTARVGAQSVGLFAAPSTSTVEVSNSLTYTIIVTNNSIAQETIWVTNTFSGPVLFSTYSTPEGTVSNTTNSFTFFLGAVDIGTTNVMTLTVEPLALGNLTNTIVVNSETGITNITAATNLVVPVITTNQADLGVTLSGFPPIAYSNDWVTYDLAVTNAGPANAPNVFLTNTIPTNEVELLAVSPTNETYQIVNSNFIFNLGTLAVGAVTNLQFTVQPTNTGVFTFSASVGSTTETDPNTANNSFTTNLTVTNFLAADLVATTSSTQSFDHLTGREEQVITLSNSGSSAIPAARVIVTGLTNTNWLSNAVGTNNGNPYVLYDAPLAINQSVNLTLQFYPAYTSFLFASKQLDPVAVEPVDISLPGTGITSTNLNIVLETNISNDFLVEFKAIPNRNYAIAYSDNGSNWLAAQPPFFVSANYGLWIDYGPPGTLNNTNTPAMRMYQVYMYPQTP